VLALLARAGFSLLIWALEKSGVLDPIEAAAAPSSWGALSGKPRLVPRVADIAGFGSTDRPGQSRKLATVSPQNR
jgi:hypothetical protein